jgi:hypothetical protein
VFTEAAGSWEQVAELKGSDTVAGDDFGYAVAVSGTTVLVGASRLRRWSAPPTRRTPFGRFRRS